MRAFRFSHDVIHSRNRLTPTVLQVAEMRGMYRAELARVMGLQCRDIGALTPIKEILSTDSEAW